MERTLIGTALAAAVALAMATPATPARAADPAMEKMMNDAMEAIEAGEIEKCYGVAKAGGNDCQTASASCAGSATQDFDKSAFVMVPAGTCGKLAGGSAQPS